MNIELKPIKSKKDYMIYLNWVDTQFDKRIKPGTPEGGRLQVILLLIRDYEEKHYPIPSPDPIEAIKQRMQEMGIKNKDLVGKVGSKGYVSAILNKRKPMTLELAKLFHKELGIAAETLLS